MVMIPWIHGPHLHRFDALDWGLPGLHQCRFYFSTVGVWWRCHSKNRSRSWGEANIMFTYCKGRYRFLEPLVQIGNVFVHFRMWMTRKIENCVLCQCQCVWELCLWASLKGESRRFYSEHILARVKSIPNYIFCVVVPISKCIVAMLVRRMTKNQKNIETWKNQ